MMAACGVETQIPCWDDEVRYPLGRTRWPIERTLTWLKRFRRIRTLGASGALVRGLLASRLLPDRLATPERLLSVVPLLLDS